jgi:hypothetical protein
MEWLALLAVGVPVLLSGLAVYAVLRRSGRRGGDGDPGAK